MKFKKGIKICKNEDFYIECTFKIQNRLMWLLRIVRFILYYIKSISHIICVLFFCAIRWVIYCLHQKTRSYFILFWSNPQTNRILARHRTATEIWGSTRGPRNRTERTFDGAEMLLLKIEDVLKKCRWSANAFTKTQYWLAFCEKENFIPS